MSGPLVTMFANVHETELEGHYPLARVLQDIRAGRYAEQIKHLRALPYKSGAYKEYKETLPAFTMSGTFASRERATKMPLAHSGIIQADLDEVDNLKWHRD